MLSEGIKQNCQRQKKCRHRPLNSMTYKTLKPTTTLTQNGTFILSRILTTPTPDSPWSLDSSFLTSLIQFCISSLLFSNSSHSLATSSSAFFAKYRKLNNNNKIQGSYKRLQTLFRNFLGHFKDQTDFSRSSPRNRNKILLVVHVIVKTNLYFLVIK